MNSKVSPKNTNNKNKNKKYFFLGILFFSTGIIGLFHDLWNTYNTSIEDILPKNTSFFIETNTQKISQKIGDDINVFKFFKLLEQYEEKIDIKKISPWAGSKASFGRIDSTSFFAVRYRSKKKAKKFLKDTFLLPNESFINEKIPNGSIYFPEFSGKFSFSFVGNWLIFTEDREVLKKIIQSENKLSQTQEFESHLFSSNIVAKGFFTSEFFTNREEEKNSSGLIKTFGSIIESGKFYIKEQEEDLTLSLTLKTSVGGLKENNSIIPELAQFVDENTLFFINGIDIYKRYVHTKTFLENIHPELSRIFDGILEAEAQEIFGPKFDFTADFLSKMNGQYAIVIDFENPISPFINTTLITGFGKSDSATKIKDFHETLRFAQGKFSTKIESVELPNGKMREELVATNPKEIVIEEHKKEKGVFYTTLNPSSDTKISYGFLENYLVFSTNKNPVENIFSGIFTPLTENKYFRNWVLLGEEPSGSYGIIDNFKLGIAIDSFKKENDENIFSVLAEKFPKIIFSRKTQEKEISWKFLFTAQ